MDDPVMFPSMEKLARQQYLAEIERLNIIIEELEKVLEKIADTDSRNGMLMSPYEAVILARETLASHRKQE